MIPCHNIKLLMMTFSVFLCLFGLGPPPVSYAAENPAILLLNSDASVEKYRRPQEEFQKTIELPLSIVDIGKKKWDLADIEELVYDEEPDLIYCIGAKAFKMVRKYAGDTPIVFSSTINWLRLPLTEQSYGVSNELHAGMELMLFRYIFPEIQTVGVLYSQKYTGEWFKGAKKQAEEIEYTLLGHDVTKKSSLSTLKKLLPQVDAFWLISDPEVIPSKEELHRILKECETRKIPVFSYHEAFAKFGVVLTVSVDIPTIGRQAAGLAMELLAGEIPEEKVQFPAGSHMILNMKTITEYNLPYNEEALGSVNAIIE